MNASVTAALDAAGARTALRSFSLGTLKASGLLAVCGYISLRSHLNHLGAPSGYSLGFDRYLMETYHFFQVAVVPAILLMVAACLSVSLLFLLRPAWFRRLKLSVDHVQPTPARIAALMFLTLVLHVALLLGAAGAGTDIAVRGELDPRRIVPTGSWALFWSASLLCIVAFLLADRMRSALAGPNLPEQRWLGALLLGLMMSVLLLALELPLYYGAALRSPEYARAELTLTRAGSPDRTVCGLVILEDSSNVTLWYTQDKRGRFLVLPRAQAAGLTYGPVTSMEKCIDAGCCN